MRLSRDVSPISIVKSLGRRSKALASSLMIVLLAMPSTAGAWTETIRRVGSPAVPPTLLLDALAQTWMLKMKV